MRVHRHIGVQVHPKVAHRIDWFNVEIAKTHILTWQNLTFYQLDDNNDLTLIQPVYKWMHWATIWCHSDLFWAATSASFQVIPILNKSLLTVLLQFVCGQPGPLLNPGTSKCNTCQGMHWRSIRITCPSQHSLLSLSMSLLATDDSCRLQNSKVHMSKAYYSMLPQTGCPSCHTTNSGEVLKESASSN